MFKFSKYLGHVGNYRKLEKMIRDSSDWNSHHLAHALLLLEPVYDSIMDIESLWNKLISQLELNPSNVEKVTLAIQIYAFHFMTKISIEEFKRLQDTITSQYPNTDWTLFNLLLKLNLEPKTCQEYKEWIKDWTSQAYSTESIHSQHTCSLFIRFAITSLERGEFEYKVVCDLWNFLKVQHEFSPLLRDYHFILKSICIPVVYTREDRDLKRKRCEEWMLKLKGSGISPTAETYSLLFHSCIYSIESKDSKDSKDSLKPKKINSQDSSTVISNLHLQELVDDTNHTKPKRFPGFTISNETSPWHPIDTDNNTIDQSEEYNEAWLSMNHPNASIPLQDLSNYPNSNSNPSRQIPKPSFQWKWNRRNCFIVLFLCIVFAVFLTLGLTVFVHKNTSVHDPDFDESSGARGMKPSLFYGIPLPVLNVLPNSTENGSLVYFGVSIDWTKDDPEHVNLLLNVSAAIQTATIYISDTLELTAQVNSSGILHVVPDYLNWTANLIKGTGAIFGIDVIPSGNVSMNALIQMGSKCVELNAMNISILLRFQPEMNGMFLSCRICIYKIR